MTGKRRRGRDPRPPTPPAVPPPAQPPVPPPSAQPPVIVARAKTRRELRAERKRQQRRRLGTAGVAAVVVGALVVAAAVTFGVKKVTDDPKPKPQGQTTLLLAVEGTGGKAVNSALLAHDDRTKRGVELLLPARVLTEVCGFGNQQLGQILGLPDGQRVMSTAVGDLLGGVTVDGSWVLTTEQLTRLVTEVRGITVDVDVNVLRTRSDGTREVVVQAGPGQRLSGPQAAAYATYTVGGEPASANLVRLQAVVEGLLAALPAKASAVEDLVGSLGRGGASTLGKQRLAELLVGLAGDARGNRMLPSDLPVQKIDAGGAPTYRVDAAPTRQFVSANLAASWPASARGERTRVFVQNGVGTPGLVGTACTRLVKAGYAFAGSGNATEFGHDKSAVLVFDRSIDTARVGDAVARALRLPTGDVAVSSAGQNVADVLVILGKDYKP